MKASEAGTVNETARDEGAAVSDGVGGCDSSDEEEAFYSASEGELDGFAADDGALTTVAAAPYSAASAVVAAVASACANEKERAELVAVCQMFPNVDPHFIGEQLAQLRLSCAQLIDMILSAPYPTFKERMAKEHRDRRRAHFLDTANFDMEEFLFIFNEPEQYFAAPDRAVTELYRQHARVFLLDRYPLLLPNYIDDCLSECGCHLLHTVRRIEAAATEHCEGLGSPDDAPNDAPARDGRGAVVEWPEELDEQFFREVQFVLNETTIKAAVAERRDRRAARLAEAREKGELQQCQCCLDGDVLLEEAVLCDDSADLHVFCRECVRRHVDSLIANGEWRVGCLAAGCEEYYASGCLRRVVRPAAYAQLLHRLQQDEVRAAGMPNIESCPACHFGMAMDCEEERSFRCHNPDCLKVSCRQCWQESHVPLPCDQQSERDVETRLRTFVENCMAEAMIRVCPSCARRIMETDGCNHMTCRCGAQWCYACGQPWPCVCGQGPGGARGRGGTRRPSSGRAVQKRRDRLATPTDSPPR